MIDKFDINKLIRRNLINLKPYSSARDEFSGEANIFLDANENSYGSVTNVKNNRYPDPHQKELKSLIGKIKKIRESNIFLGNGSDEAIDLIFRAFGEPGKDKVILVPPTYGMYEVSANINDIGIIKVPLTINFQLNTEKIISEITDFVKLIFICSPNNPTSNLLEKTDIEIILNNFNGIVVLDEAYIDFSPEDTWLSSLEKYPNLIILQTFSKAWGLSNIRLGMAFASKQIIDLLNNIKPPYNINGITQRIAIKGLKHEDKKNTMVKLILSGKYKLINELENMNCIEKIYPSDSNFLLVKTTDAKSIYNYLISKNIVVRDRSSQPLCENCLRITVGTEKENISLIKALNKYQH